MLLKPFILSILIFIIGLFGLFYYRRNYLIILLFFEVLLLSVNYNLIIFSIAFNDIMGQLLILCVLIVAGVESAIGLSILIIYYRLTGNIDNDSIFSKIRG